MKLLLYFDGAAMPNPGVRGVGAVLKDPSGTIVKQISERLDGLGTNNEAEYTAIIRGMEEALKLGCTELKVFGDSQMAVRQLQGTYRVTKPNLRPLHKRVEELSKEFDRVEIDWIPREQNKEADALSYAPLASASEKDPTGTHPIKAKEDLGSAPSAREHDILCPKCRKPCVLTIQRASNGEERIRQSCPDHGFIVWAPKVEPFLSLARKNTP